MGISKSYECHGDCLVYFKITVEPDKDEATIRDQFPSSARIIEKGLEKCPFCGGDIEESN